MMKGTNGFLAAALFLGLPAIASGQQPIAPVDARALTNAELEPGEIDQLGELMVLAGPQREAAFYEVVGAMPEGDRGNFAAFLLSLGYEERGRLLDYLVSLDGEGRSGTAYGFASMPVANWQGVREVIDADRPDLLDRVIVSHCRIIPQQVAGQGEGFVIGDAPAMQCPPRVTRGINMRRANWSEAPFQAQFYRKGQSLAEYYTPKMAREDRALRGEARAPFEREHVCGAVYIGGRWLLTAAHCIGFGWDNRPGEFFSGRGIRLGTANIAAPALEIPIDSVVRHAAYRDTLHGDDIALLRLARAPTPQEIATFQMRAADLPNRSTPKMQFDQSLSASGWGLTGATDDTSKPLDRSGKVQRTVSILRIGSINYRAGSACETNAHYKALDPNGFHMTDGQLCAGSNEQVDTCRGDSGGPLVWWRGTTPILVGLVSFGPGCGQLDTPGVYTNVRTYALNGWIAGAKSAAKTARIVTFR